MKMYRLKLIGKQKRLLKSLESEAKDEETGEVDTEAIAHRLEEDALVKSHRLHRELADSLIIEDDATSAFTVHRYSVIAAVLCPKGRYIVSCGKDGIIAKYDTETDEVRRIQYFHKNADNHKGSINALAISPDSKWLVTGGADNLIKIWDFETLRHVHEFRGHRGEVTSLVFRLDSSSELFSGSKDRSVKVFRRHFICVI
ncbi:hypothetical protein L596_002805 [Steinernema carpocapsae]|uniref:Uncharacterized protein n=1 Tax=Steinernema carpocapsae TaxID=34508 RepID=A0A4U8UQR9_STECR|nr:hypothetical protein L596_002805 [Steinernema carpocapsae]